VSAGARIVSTFDTQQAGISYVASTGTRGSIEALRLFTSATASELYDYTSSANSKRVLSFVLLQQRYWYHRVVFKIKEQTWVL
jgi:hypothetical protein